MRPCAREPRRLARGRFGLPFALVENAARARGRRRGASRLAGSRGRSRTGERIGVFGDYDADGITSAAVLYLALSRYTDNLVVKLPVRQTGYGLLEPYVRDLFAEGVDLLVTADCGISNRAEVSWPAAGDGGDRDGPPHPAGGARPRPLRRSPSSTRSCGTRLTRSREWGLPGSSPGPSPARWGTPTARSVSGDSWIS